MSDRDTPGDLLDHVSRCLALHGSPGFAHAYLDLIDALGADQVMIFSYDADHAACLMARNFRQYRTGRRLAADYLDGWFRQDPLFLRALQQVAGEVDVLRIDTLDSPMGAEYRARFFDEPGLSGKLSVLAAGTNLRLAINLYRAGIENWTPPDAILTILGHMALLHFERRRAGGIPDALVALSERERAVCMGMLDGKKAEAIAADLGVAPTSVVTYRRRAYDKLGISSRGELFAICRA
ncbi:MAG: LuxR C-terminal-related transcriptional regulator [Rhodobacterales bacterium]|nr:LuxR C-terminal-related transcriptional regulator [Rhodobacterales bacterium]MDX5389838.1 LuxR C-terminal-related transcriptional regulator [Rhodobacterales bacterium]MDX5489535.1 LuxR C-terminal-related transcriptional regulator [Rhodobacterales bacterium]